MIFVCVCVWGFIFASIFKRKWNFPCLKIAFFDNFSCLLFRGWLKAEGFFSAAAVFIHIHCSPPSLQIHLPLKHHGQQIVPADNLNQKLTASFKPPEKMDWFIPRQTAPKMSLKKSQTTRWFSTKKSCCGFVFFGEELLALQVAPGHLRHICVWCALAYPNNVVGPWLV